VPWYWSEGDTELLLGVPRWAAVAVGVSVCVSAFTAWLLRNPWPDEVDGEGESDSERGDSDGQKGAV